MLHETIHSADVTIYLEVDGKQIEVAGCLGNTCTLRYTTELSPSYADLVIIIDGHESRKRIYLKNGIEKHSKDVEYSLAA